MTGPCQAESAIPERVLEAVWPLWSHSGQFRMRMMGVSMLPIFREGDELIVEPQPESIRVGDVVVYRRAGRSVVHRVVGMRRSGGEKLLMRKGDRVRSFDPALPLHMILGRVAKKRTISGITDYDSLFWLLANTIIAGISATIGQVYSLYRERLVQLASDPR